MSHLIKHKRVEFTELFYDLVFVYAISKTTALIHHLHHGILSWESLSAFLVTILVLVNTWMIQTVFTNRYGKNSLFNILTMFANMAMLLLISSMIVSDWQGYFNYFCWTTGTLSLTLFLQYLVQYFKEEATSKDRPLIRGFLLVTGLRTLMVYLAALFPVSISSSIFLLGIVATFLIPLTFKQRQAQVPINFPHLIERISLLVIITFGEMILGIANFFTPETFSFHSVLYFLIVALLFLYYFGQFDHAIDETSNSRGLYLIYSHYPIFIGLLMVTVSLSFLQEQEANRPFVVCFLYIGLALFHWAVLSNSRDNKEHLRFTKSYVGLQIGLLLCGFIASLLFSHEGNIVLYITTSILFAIEAHFIAFYTRQSQKAKKEQIEWI